MGSTGSKVAASAPVKPEPAIKDSRVSELMDPRSPSKAIDRTPIQLKDSAMGSTGSKMAASAPVKPEPAIKDSRVSELMDPRSPSKAIDRTPIQVGGFVPRSVAEVKSDRPLLFTGPHSPSAGTTRTPIGKVMRARVGSFARRLVMIIQNEGRAPKSPQKRTPDTMEEVLKDEELTSTDSLLAPQPFQNLDCLANPCNPHTPVIPPVQCEADLSPFMLLEQPQVEVELQTEADISFEEAEEAKESPLHNRLSMSLMACHEGVTSSHIFAEVCSDGESLPDPGVDVVGDGADHSYAPPISVDAEINKSPLPGDADDTPAEDSISTVSSVELEKIPSPVDSNLERENPLPQLVSIPEQPTLPNQICCPTFDPKSPSKVVFKPQWLGKGFGANYSKNLEKEKPLPQLVSSPDQPKLSNPIRYPTFDPNSPSIEVFEPKWLGKCFSANYSKNSEKEKPLPQLVSSPEKLSNHKSHCQNGLRVKSVHGQSGKGGSARLAVRVAVRNATNENKGQSGKCPQGRSPLQILKENNSPRDHRNQMKVKTSTPDKPRLGQMDSRMLSVCVDKEN